MLTAISILFIAGVVLGSGSIILAGVLRCGSCGRWHEDPDEERRCREEPRR